MNLTEPRRIEADSIAEFYLCDDVFISLRLRISGSARQLVEESETHAFLPRSLIRAIPRHPIACRTRRVDRHNPDVPYLSQDRAQSSQVVSVAEVIEPAWQAAETACAAARLTGTAGALAPPQRGRRP